MREIDSQIVADQRPSWRKKSRRFAGAGKSAVEPRRKPKQTGAAARVSLDERTQTLFLNGKAIDDPGSTMVADKSKIALSATLPGLAEATLRKDGAYDSFRKAITDTALDVASDAHQTGKITLKLFNFIVQKLAPILLRYDEKVETDTLQRAWKASRTGFPSIHSRGQSCRNLPELEDVTQGYRLLLLHLCA